MSANAIDNPAIQAAMKAAVAEECGAAPETLTADMTSAAIDGWDSVAHVRIMMNLEARLGIEIDIQLTYQLADMGALANHVAGRLAARGN